MCKWALRAATFRVAAAAEAGDTAAEGGEGGNDTRVVLGVRTLTNGGDANGNDVGLELELELGGGKVNSEEEETER